MTLGVFLLVQFLLRLPRARVGKNQGEGSEFQMREPEVMVYEWK